MYPVAPTPTLEPESAPMLPSLKCIKLKPSHSLNLLPLTIAKFYERRLNTHRESLDILVIFGYWHSLDRAIPNP